MPSPILIVHRDNGFGLSRDAAILASALGSERVVTWPRGAAHERRRRHGWDWCSPRSPRSLLALHLEHVWPGVRARRHIIIPNPEWWDRHDAARAGRIDQVWAKSADAAAWSQRIGLGRRVPFRIGFSSIDRQPDVSPGLCSEWACLHVAGASLTKGTAFLVGLWRRHPEWPRLTIVADPTAHRPPADLPSHVTWIATVISSRTPEGRRCLADLMVHHRFHVYPGCAEAWGHALVEGAGVGAVVAATALPTLDWIPDAGGVLFSATRDGQHHGADIWRPDADSASAVLSALFAESPRQQQQRAFLARSWFMATTSGFAERLRVAVAAVLDVP